MPVQPPIGVVPIGQPPVVIHPVAPQPVVTPPPIVVAPPVINRPPVNLPPVIGTILDPPTGPPVVVQLPSTDQRLVQMRQAYITGVGRFVQPGQATALPAAAGLDLDGARTALLAGLHPATTVAILAAARVPVIAGMIRPDPVAPIMAGPVFTDAAYTPLVRASHDAFVPGLDAIPPDSVTLVQTNPTFIAAYLAGLNSALDYGRVPGEWSLSSDRHRAEVTGSGQRMTLQTDMLLGIEANHVRARHVLQEGEELYCALSWDEAITPPANADEANARLNATSKFWRHWLARARIPDHELRPLIQRSALAIKGLTYMPTGATVAALTTSLPETPGGERNWDYRYTWIRDSTFTLQALHFLDLDWEANEFMQFIADLERGEDGALQIMYGIDGRRDLTETFLDQLSGYAGAHPVRTGNGAFDQRQNDVFGAALDSVLLHTRRSQRLPRRLWPLIQSQAECAKAVWRKPDQGIWEARGKPQHYVSSKLMCWVAMDRAAKLAEIRGDRDIAAGWRAERRRDKGRHPRPRPRRTWGAAAALRHRIARRLDPAGRTLRLPPADDSRLKASVLAIADELTENGFVLRYRTNETDDGLSGKEGTFVICSFWLVSALAIVGEMQRARDLMQRLAKVASPLGLYAEEFDVETGRHLGNFPQAFSHLAAVEAAGRIVLADRLAEITG